MRWWANSTWDEFKRMKGLFFIRGMSSLILINCLIFKGLDEVFYGCLLSGYNSNSKCPLTLGIVGVANTVIHQFQYVNKVEVFLFTFKAQVSYYFTLDFHSISPW